MDPTGIALRLEAPGDEAAVRGVHVDAFPVSQRRVQSVESVLVDWLREDGDVRRDLTFVAESRGTIVASVVCSRATISRRPSVGLGPIGVCRSHQRRGIGSRLMRAVLAAARDAGDTEIVLLGSPDFYARFGFRPAVDLGITAPRPWGERYFQAVALGAHGDGSSGGAFRYAPAFERLEESATDD